MIRKRALYTLPMPSTSFKAEAYFDGKGVVPAIRYSYVRDGTEHRSGIGFSGVLSMRSRAERCCAAWHIDGAYDTLIEIEGSPWLDEMRTDTQEQWRNKWEMHHYMIYLDSAGCFEVIAESWVALQET